LRQKPFGTKSAKGQVIFNAIHAKAPASITTVLNAISAMEQAKKNAFDATAQVFFIPSSEHSEFNYIELSKKFLSSFFPSLVKIDSG